MRRNGKRNLALIMSCALISQSLISVQAETKQPSGYDVVEATATDAVRPYAASAEATTADGYKYPVRRKSNDYRLYGNGNKSYDSGKNRKISGNGDRL